MHESSRPTLTNLFGLCAEAFFSPTTEEDYQYFVNIVKNNGNNKSSSFHVFRIWINISLNNSICVKLSLKLFCF